MHNRKHTYLITLLAILSGFILLSVFVYYFPNSPIDLKFSEEIQERHNPAMDWTMKMVSWFGYMPWSAIMVACTSLIFLICKYKKEALFTLLTLLSGVVSSGLKIIINRPRPTQDLVHIIEKANHKSFPSGHVVFYVTFFGMLFLIMRHHLHLSNIIRYPIMAISLFLIFTIPLSRVYLGAHWFTDVAGGFFAGLFCLAVLGYFYLFKKQTATRRT